MIKRYKCVVVANGLFPTGQQALELLRQAEFVVACDGRKKAIPFKSKRFIRISAAARAASVFPSPIGASRMINPGFFILAATPYISFCTRFAVKWNLSSKKSSCFHAEPIKHPSDRLRCLIAFLDRLLSYGSGSSVTDNNGK